MPELTRSAWPEPPAQDPRGAPEPPGSRLRPLLVDAGLILGTFLVMGVIGGFVWHQVTPLAEFTRTKDNALMGQPELAKQFSTDGWFFVIAAVGGLLGGIGLTVWRWRDPVATVLLILVGALLAAFVMRHLGQHLGPDDPRRVIQHTKVGGHVPLSLKPTAKGVSLVWPIAALFGSIGVLWGTSPRTPRV